MINALLSAGAIGLQITHGTLPPPDTNSPATLHIAVHHQGPLPTQNLDPFDILLTQTPNAPRPWVSVPNLPAELSHLQTAFAHQPLAATILAQTLRLTPTLNLNDALLVESLAYATLLASPAFHTWRAALQPLRPRKSDPGPPIRTERVGTTLHIILNHPNARNAITAPMRDALADALALACLAPDAPPIILRAEGATFSIGGDLAEFGQATNPAAAHAIRTARSAVRAIHPIAHRVTARLHGPCIGAGIEIPAAAAHITARPGTTFRLPELAMGLIPGAGGTATIPHRIGRHRTCYLALSGHSIDAPIALSWGLIDAIAP